MARNNYAKRKPNNGGVNQSPHPTVKKAKVIRKAGKGGNMVTGAKRGKNR